MNDQSGEMMPFIIIDQGSAAIRQYKAVNSPLLTRVGSVAPIQQKTNQDSQRRQHAYDKPELNNQKVSSAEEIMSSPVHHLEQKSATIQMAWDIFQKHSIKHLPITKNNKLIGIVTERDILKIYALKNTDKEHWYKTKVFAAGLTMDIHRISKILFDNKIGALPIIDEQQSLLGIVTRSDILKITSQYGPLEFWA
jgi:acetoin utilization protein AcuB